MADLNIQGLHKYYGESEAKLREIFESRKDKTMFIAGAETLRYRDIIEVIDAAKGAGVEKVGIVTAAMRRAGSTGRMEVPSAPGWHW